MMIMAPPQHGHGQVVRAAGVAVCVGERGRVLGQQLAADGDRLSTSPCGQEAEMADAHKAARQHMQQKPAQEFVGRDASSCASCCRARNPSIGM